MTKPNDITTDGQPCYFLSVNGLEGCMAQGATLGGAIKNLKSELERVCNDQWYKDDKWQKAIVPEIPIDER